MCKGKLHTPSGKGRKPRYCSDKCKQKSYRERQKRNAQQQQKKAQKPLRNSNPLKSLIHKSYEWYTPVEYISAVREVFGGQIELDPASSAVANQTVQAERYFDQDTNGLLHEWRSHTVFFNPPHNRRTTTGPWVQKLLSEYRAGNISEAIMLVDAATETRWFSVLYNFPMCFVEGRISFLNGEGKPAGSPIGGSVFVYLGKQQDKFSTVFQRFGKVLFLSQFQL
jgi:ParB family chromosome partitioning protein